jgi:hypothetical protein
MKTSGYAKPVNILGQTIIGIVEYVMPPIEFKIK